jgi:hypothetical protein
MSSARRTSVQRHIDNPNIHGGGATVIPFTEYTAGIRGGKYRAGLKPIFGASDQPLLSRLVKKISIEFENEIAKKVAIRICRKISETDYNIVEALAIKSLFFRQFKETFGGDF